MGSQAPREVTQGFVTQAATEKNPADPITSNKYLGFPGLFFLFMKTEQKNLKYAEELAGNRPCALAAACGPQAGCGLLISGVISGQRGERRG